MKRRLILVLAAIFLSRPVFAYDAEAVMPEIRTPEEIAVWFRDNFEYERELLDRWQMPEETLAARKGDCEDFAILTSRMLSERAIPNAIIFIKFDQSMPGHAICAWKREDGRYSYISTCKLHNTEDDSIEAMVSEEYPEWKEIVLFESGRRYPTVTIRGRLRGEKNISRCFYKSLAQCIKTNGLENI